MCEPMSLRVAMTWARGSTTMWPQRGSGSRFRQRTGVTIACLCVLVGQAGMAAAETGSALPERVTLPSADGATTLVGYLFKPATAAGKAPGVVMMHGRGGVYAANARGKYTADTLSLRHKAWGRIWADAGYVALLVDSFRPARIPRRGSPASPTPTALRPSARSRCVRSMPTARWHGCAPGPTSSPTASACTAGRTAAAPR